VSFSLCCDTLRAFREDAESLGLRRCRLSAEQNNPESKKKLSKLQRLSESLHIEPWVILLAGIQIGFQVARL
jgi:hypothetical protein